MPVRVYTSFDELPESYAEFFHEIERDNFFLSRRWFKNLASTAIEPDVKIRLYAVENYDSGAKPLVFLAALTPAGQDGSIFSNRWIGPRTLSAMTNYQSVQFAPLISPSVENTPDHLRELISFLCDERPRWSLIDFNLLDPQAHWFKLLADQFAAAGMVVRSYFYAGKRFETTDGLSYQNYIKRRSNNERSGIRRHRRQLEEGYQVRFEIITGTATTEGLDAAIAAYERVLAASWKEPENFPQYTAGMIRACAASQTLRLGLVYVNDEPVAAQIWVVTGGRATIYKLHYDERFKRYSVGSILTAYLMEHVLDGDGVREVDFGMFDDQHKKAWMSQLRELHGFVAFNPRTMWGIVALIRFEIGRATRAAINVAKPVLKPGYLLVKRLVTSLNGFL